MAFSHFIFDILQIRAKYLPKHLSFLSADYYAIQCIPVLLYGLEAIQLNKSQISSIDFVILRVAVYANTSTTAFHKTTHVVIVTHFARYRRSLRNHLNCSCARAVARLVRCHAAAAGQSHSLLDDCHYYPRRRRSKAARI